MDAAGRQVRLDSVLPPEDRQRVQTRNNTQISSATSVRVMCVSRRVSTTSTRSANGLLDWFMVLLYRCSPGAPLKGCQDFARRTRRFALLLLSDWQHIFSTNLLFLLLFNGPQQNEQSASSLRLSSCVKCLGICCHCTARQGGSRRI